jgi:hypothetical protein
MGVKTRYTLCVARDMRRMLLAFLVAGGLACAEVDDFRPVADAAADGDPFPCHAPGADPLNLGQADVLILLDRSGSMDTAYGSGTRYQALATTLSDLVRTYAAHVRFGYQEMPGRQGCGTELAGACCASPPLVGIADDSAQVVMAAIASALPMDGNTPTAASLQEALAYYATLADGIYNRYVLLATDGAPNCTLAGSLSNGAASDVTSAACAEALAQVNAMVALGVRVIVLGVGMGLTDVASAGGTCLDALAHAGGAAASPGSPGFFTDSDPLPLSMFIEQIFGGTTRPSCSVRLCNPISDTSNLAVTVDGKSIPRGSSDGWQFDSPTSPKAVIIKGKYCDQIRAFQTTNVEVGYYCAAPLEGRGCE